MSKTINLESQKLWFINRIDLINTRLKYIILRGIPNFTSKNYYFSIPIFDLNFPAWHSFDNNDRHVYKRRKLRTKKTLKMCKKYLFYRDICDINCTLEKNDSNLKKSNPSSFNISEGLKFYFYKYFHVYEDFHEFYANFT